MKPDKALKRMFDSLWPRLDERSRRLFAAAQARKLGHGGISAASALCGLSRVTLTKGVRELDAAPLPPSRVRRPGTGRPRLEKAQPRFESALDSLLEESTRGDPDSALRWTCKSTRTLARQLAAGQVRVSHDKIARALRQKGYSLQANRKTEEGGDHPDRDAQFHHINEQVKQALRAGQPVISVDTKKKELLGNYDNKGRQWGAIQSCGQKNGVKAF